MSGGLGDVDAMLNVARRLHETGHFASRLDATSLEHVTAALGSRAAWLQLFAPPPAPTPAQTALLSSSSTTAAASNFSAFSTPPAKSVKRTYARRQPPQSARAAATSTARSTPASSTVATLVDEDSQSAPLLTADVLSTDARVVAAFRVRSLLFDELLRESSHTEAMRLDDMYYLAPDAPDEPADGAALLPQDAAAGAAAAVAAVSNGDMIVDSLLDLLPQPSTLAALSRGAPLVVRPPTPPPPPPPQQPEQQEQQQQQQQSQQHATPVQSQASLDAPPPPDSATASTSAVAPTFQQPPTPSDTLSSSAVFNVQAPPPLPVASGLLSPTSQLPAGAQTPLGDDDGSQSDPPTSPSLASSAASVAARRSARKRQRVSRSTRAVLTGSRTISRGAEEDEELKEAAALRAAMTECLRGLSGLTRARPFLLPVRKTDAPDYFDIIKQPMDLGTMSKKVQRGEYLSKTAFANDLSLIWTNCRTYNVGPASQMFVEHANYMEVQANRLLWYVPDVDLAHDSPQHSPRGDDSSFDNSVRSSNRLEPSSIGYAANSHGGSQRSIPDVPLPPRDAAIFPPSEPVPSAVDAAHDNTRALVATHIVAGESQEQCWARIAGTALGAAEGRARQQRRGTAVFGETPALVRDAESMGVACAEASGFVHPTAVGCFPELRPVRSAVPPLPLSTVDAGTGMCVHRTQLPPVALVPAAELNSCVATALLRAGFSSASRAAVGVLRDLLDSFFGELGRTLRLRADQATGDDEVRVRADVPLRPLSLLGSTLDDMGATVSLEVLHRFLQREQHVHGAASGHVRALKERNQPDLPDDRTLFEQALILAHRQVVSVQAPVRERAAVMSTLTEAYSEDLDARPYMTDYGRFGKRRAVVQQMWLGDDGSGGNAAPPPQHHGGGGGRRAAGHHQIEGIAPGVGASALAASMSSMPSPLIADAQGGAPSTNPLSISQALAIQQMQQQQRMQQHAQQHAVAQQSQPPQHVMQQQQHQQQIQQPHLQSAQAPQQMMLQPQLAQPHMIQFHQMPQRPPQPPAGDDDSQRAAGVKRKQAGANPKKPRR
jgi:hypothetical protein